MAGTWRLVYTEETMKDGSTRPFPGFGAHAKGFLMYQSDGYMCAVIMNPDRYERDDLPFATATHATPEEKLATARGTFTYAGRYEIDVKRERIIHLPEVASKPEYVGSRQIRPYRFEGGRLILGDIETDDPAVARWKIVWEKAV
jgi:hypothetical protein